MLNLKKGKALLIAEIGGNHEGDIDKAKELMISASEAGADIVKFQTYTANGLVNKHLRPDRYEHFQRFTLDDKDWISIAEEAKKNNIKFSSSLWESRFIKLLDDYICLYKVGSGDISNHDLINQFCELKKPVIFSTAMSTLDDISRTMEFIVSRYPNIIQENNLGILQCTAMYDEPNNNEVNLSVMGNFKERYKCIVGYSDHSIGLNGCIAAISSGAEIIEFHYTDDKSKEFRDHKLSLDCNDLKLLSSFNEDIDTLIGSSRKEILLSEKANKKEFRRGLYLKQDTKLGSLILKDDLIALRPDEGISAWDMNKIVNKKAKRDIAALLPLKEDYFE